MATPEDPQLSHGRIAYVLNRVDLEADRYHRSIWMITDGRPRQVTNGPDDHRPRWSPDGTRLAFLRGDQGISQVAVMEDAEPRVVTDFELGVEEFCWSPDGTRWAVVATTWLEPGIDREERRRRPARITAVPYRFDGKGRMDDRRRRIHLVGVEDGSYEAVTDGEADESDVCWHPDGFKLAFISDRHPRRALELGIDVWELDLADRRLDRAVPHRGMWRMPSYRPDGVLHVLGRPEAEWPSTGHVYRREADGSLTDLTAHLDRSPISLSAGPARVEWDGHTLITGIEERGRFGVISVAPDGEVTLLVEGERSVGGFDVEEGRLIFTASTVTSTGELYDGEVAVTSHGEDLGLVEGDHFVVPVGDEEIDVWVYLPPGEEPVPALLNIHGGPASQYGFGFFDEFQVYTGAGYGVVACNPRGSSGRGEVFAQAVVGEGWGKIDMEDILTALDSALARHPRLDPDRLGIMGGSYGGFMTAWMIAHQSRFRSAVVERALLSWNSFAGTSDIGANFPDAYLAGGGRPSPEQMWEKSPLSVADRTKTPTLIIHSDEDWRCPIEQAEQYFLVLLRQGVEVAFLRFPGEGHEMSRSGKPRHRLERFEAILDWHGRFLSLGPPSTGGGRPAAP